MKRLIIIICLFATLLFSADFDKIRLLINKEVSRFHGQIGISLYDINRGITIGYNLEKKFPTASLIKVPIMMEVYRQVSRGLLDITEKIVYKKSDYTRGSGILKTKHSGNAYTIKYLVELMITYSDNIAANMLIRRIGLSSVNQMLQYYGFKDTKLTRKILDFKARRAGFENITTVRDLNSMYYQIYNKTLFDDEAVCEEMLNILSKQKYRDRLPLLLPKNLEIAHKTGRLNKVEHDAGIIYYKKEPYILCIMTKTTDTNYYAKTQIAQISKKIYDYYNIDNNIQVSTIKSSETEISSN